MNDVQHRRDSGFTRGEPLFVDWRESVLNGTGPIVYPHTLPVPELSPGIVTLIGGAPGAGKTAIVMQCVVEALRVESSRRALVCNVEMSPTALLDRQLARLTGIDGEVIRHRRFTAEHRDRLESGLATVESFMSRLTFLRSPFDLANVASAADACDADIIVVDYVQRFSCPGDDGDARAKVSRTMDTFGSSPTPTGRLSCCLPSDGRKTLTDARPTAGPAWRRFESRANWSSGPTTRSCSPPPTSRPPMSFDWHT